MLEISSQFDLDIQVGSNWGQPDIIRCSQILSYEEFMSIKRKFNVSSYDYFSLIEGRFSIWEVNRQHVVFRFGKVNSNFVFLVYSKTVLYQFTYNDVPYTDRDKQSARLILAYMEWTVFF